MGVKIQWNSEASLKKVINEHKKLYPIQRKPRKNNLKQKRGNYFAAWLPNDLDNFFSRNCNFCEAEDFK